MWILCGGEVTVIMICGGEELGKKKGGGPTLNHAVHHIDMINWIEGCLPDEVVDYLAELNERMYLWVELGLQTTFEETSKLINRAHDYQTYLDGVAKLRKHNIRVCTHLINGLPGESLEMMKENVRRTILDSDIQGIKLHLMHLMRKRECCETIMKVDFN